MNRETKLKRRRKEWLDWLFLPNGDKVNGQIHEKFRGVLDHALEEHSKEAIALFANVEKSETKEKKE